MKKVFFGQLLLLSAALRALEPLPLIEETLQGHVYDLEPLNGGYGSAKNFRFQIASDGFVLRQLPCRDSQEIRASQAMGELGVAPAVVCVDPDDEWLVLRYIEGVHPFQMPPANAHLMAALRRFHAADASLARGSTLVAFVYKRLQRLEEMGTPLGAQIAFARDWLDDLDEGERALCHNDLHPMNVIYTRERCWIIDWEAAALGDPLFDVAHWAWVNGLPLEQSVELYLGREPTEDELARAKQQQLLVCLVKFSQAFPKRGWEEVWSGVHRPFRPLSSFWERAVAGEIFGKEEVVELALACFDQFLVGALDEGDRCPLAVEVDLDAVGGHESQLGR